VLLKSFLSLRGLDDLLDLFFAFLLLLFRHNLDDPIDVVMILVVKLFIYKRIQTVGCGVADFVDIWF